MSEKQPDRWGGVIDATVFILFFGTLYVLLIWGLVRELT